MVFSRTLSTAGWANTTIASGARLFEDVGKSRPLDLLSSTAFSSALVVADRQPVVSVPDGFVATRCS